MSDLNIIPSDIPRSESPTSFSGKIEFRFGRDEFGVIQPISGLPSLASRVIKTFLTEKGSNPLNQLEGSGFTDLIGSFVGEKAAAAQVITRAIVEVEEYFFSVQAGVSNLPATEMLGSITLDSIDLSIEGSMKVAIIIKSVSGESAHLLLRT